MPVRLDPTDRHFARFCRSGDPAALAKVFDRTAAELLRVAAWLCGNRTDAEDLLQRTFLTAIEDRASFARQRRVLPWLLGILTNHARNLKRERARLAALPGRAAPTADPLAAAGDAEFAERLRSARATIGAPYREVLDLHLEHGCNAKEIAARLGRPAGTVRTQLVRALELLRKRLPNGFIAGLAPIAFDAASLAPIKAAVLAAANGVAGTALGSVAIASASTIGVLMSKKAITIALPILVLGIAVAVVPNLSDGEAPAPSAAVPLLAGAPATAAEPAPTANQTTFPARVAAAPVDPADVEPGFATLRVEVSWNDGSPAAGVGVILSGMSARSITLHNDRRTACTDDDGRCTLAHLRPGYWGLRTPHGTAASSVAHLTLRAGELHTETLQLGPMGSVNGRVLDDQQRPVAGASIWLAPQPDFQFEVTTTGAGGRFAVPIARGGRLQLGARKAGMAPSYALEIDAAAPPDEVMLTMRGPGSSVEGIVRGPGGEPIAYARVLIGEPSTWSLPVNGPFDQPQIRPWGREVTTGEDGRFVVAGVEPGAVNARAWAAGHAPARRELELRAGATMTCNFDLAAGAIVRGVVRDDSGIATAANVTVEGAGDRFVTPLAYASEDGHYELADLPAGPTMVIAQQGLLRAETTLQLTAGVVHEWNAALQPTPKAKSLRGVVLLPDGKPAASYWVGVGASLSIDTASLTQTSRDGRFRLKIEHGETVTIAAGERLGSPLVIVRDVAADATGITVRIPHTAMPNAHLRGRIVDSSGRPLAAQISASVPGQEQPDLARAQADGTFDLGPLRAGRLSIRISTEAHGELTLPSLQLGTDEVRDLGDVVLQLPSRLDCRLLSSDGQPADGFVTFHTRDGEWVASLRVERGQGRLDRVQPGLLLGFVIGRDGMAGGEVEVRAGVDAAIELRMQPTARIDLHIDDPSNSSVDVRIFAHDAQGHFLGLFGNLRGGLTCPLTLPAGSHTLEVRATDGRHVDVPLTVTLPANHHEIATARATLPMR